MSAVSVHRTGEPSASNVATPVAVRRWIFNSWVDILFIILTPLVATPAVLILYSSWVGVTAETISLIVTALFATGHHLPGLIRAYGDRELFERFRWRFLLAPPLLFLAYFPLYTYHYNLYRLIILVWATWHGLMQLYGFVRIYDAKVGSISRATAYWDWLVCLCGFIVPQLFRPEHVSKTLGHWYSAGGPWISSGALHAVRWTSLAISLAVAVGFTVNYVVQSRHGAKPNSLKLLMLASGIGMWWFALNMVDNLLLGVALFDICHDVQYLAIVWLYNCRRVNANPQLGRFMRYVFRRGMVLLYLGLIISYGAIGLVAPLVADGTISQIFYGILFTSTILHYYYDGFIWKVRETTNQAGLGLTLNAPASRGRPVSVGDSAHLLKWGPVIIGLALLFATDLLDPALTSTQKEMLERLYGQSVSGTTALPRGDEERSWVYSQFEQAQAIASAVPDDRRAQLRAAILLANFGRNDEAVEKLQAMLQQHPDFCEGQLILGEIHLYRGNLDQAAERFQSALSHARTAKERSSANLKLGEIALRRHDDAAAEAKFAEAIQADPSARTSVDAVRNSVKPHKSVP